MKKTRCFTLALALVLVACRAATALAAAADSAAEKLLLQLFPSASVQSVDSWFGEKQATKILYPIALRNRRGVISISDAKMQRIGGRFLAVAFEILLAKDSDIRQLTASRLSQNPPGALKLLQVVVFDATTAETIGKPNGFPIEGSAWTCTGDSCSTIRLIGFADSPKSDAFAVLEYSSHLDQKNLVVVALGADRRPVASRPVVVGDLGGESGCRVTVSFAAFSMSGEGVFGVRRSECDPSCAELCARSGVPAGKSETKVLLLSVEKAKE